MGGLFLFCNVSLCAFQNGSRCLSPTAFRLSGTGEHHIGKLFLGRKKRHFPGPWSTEQPPMPWPGGSETGEEALREPAPCECVGFSLWTVLLSVSLVIKIVLCPSAMPQALRTGSVGLQENLVGLLFSDTEKPNNIIEWPLEGELDSWRSCFPRPSQRSLGSDQGRLLLPAFNKSLVSFAK